MSTVLLVTSPLAALAIGAWIDQTLADFAFICLFVFLVVLDPKLGVRVCDRAPADAVADVLWVHLLLPRAHLWLPVQAAVGDLLPSGVAAPPARAEVERTRAMRSRICVECFRTEEVRACGRCGRWICEGCAASWPTQPRQVAARIATCRRCDQLPIAEAAR